MSLHHDSLDSVVRSRARTTGQPAVDALNSAVPMADPVERDSLEQRLLAQLGQEDHSERKPTMNFSPAVRAAYAAPRRLQISTSMLLTIAVAALCAAAVLFARLNPPPQEESLPVAAPINDGQEQAEPTATPLVITGTPTPFGSEGSGEIFVTPSIVPTSTPLGQVLPTATPIGAGINPSNAIYHTVQAGDTLVSIADAYGAFVHDIVAMNNLDPNAALVVGQQLLVGFTEIPSTATPIPLVFPTETRTATVSPLQTRHDDMTVARPRVIFDVVQAGDTLSSIANRNGVTVESLIYLNDLDPANALDVGQRLVVAIFAEPVGGEGPIVSGPTIIPFVTATPIPFDVNLYVPTYPPYTGDHVAPPSVWMLGDAHVSAPDSSGLMVSLPAARIRPTAGEQPITPGTLVNLYTSIAIPKSDMPSAAVQDDPLRPSDVVVALVPVAASVEVMFVNDDGNAIVWVSVEQGIVLNWLLNDTRALVFYGSTG